MTGWPLSDRVVLITGGARGIGAATARELARRGARPVLADLDGEALRHTATTISTAPLTIELDVAPNARGQLVGGHPTIGLSAVGGDQRPKSGMLSGEAVPAWRGEWAMLREEVQVLDAAGR